MSENGFELTMCVCLCVYLFVFIVHTNSFKHDFKLGTKPVELFYQSFLVWVGITYANDEFTTI